MVDIFEIAKVYGPADYYDINTSCIYLINEWATAKKSGIPLPAPGIRVMDLDHNIFGYVPDPKLYKTKEKTKYDIISNYWSDFSY